MLCPAAVGGNGLCLWQTSAQDFMHVGKNAGEDLVTFTKMRLTAKVMVGGGTGLGVAMERLANIKLPVGIPRATLRLLDPNMPNSEKKSIYFHHFLRHKLLLVAVWGLLPDECVPTAASQPCRPAAASQPCIASITHVLLVLNVSMTPTIVARVCAREVGMIRRFCEVFEALSEPVMRPDTLEALKVPLAEALVLWQTYAPPELLGGGQMHALWHVLLHALWWGSAILFWCFRYEHRSCRSARGIRMPVLVKHAPATGTRVTAAVFYVRLSGCPQGGGVLERVERLKPQCTQPGGQHRRCALLGDSCGLCCGVQPRAAGGAGVRVRGAQRWADCVRRAPVDAQPAEVGKPLCAAEGGAARSGVHE